MNETFELNTSSTASQQNVWHAKSKESEMIFLKARFIITTVLFVLGLFGNTSIILVLRGLKSPTSKLTIYMIRSPSWLKSLTMA
ncbi:hypothetical protein Bpfe_017327 [Biomphalaria pfeifferi]|uniref:Uncharacterized protein n=1 Tax=Biomphalaria pfeifferi TaxID=112525 RepID=A0AAD8BEN9_BIOPF|nr:hypothetical protein Bpfe_017327 [Biomphalaria pfeifferi]